MKDTKTRKKTVTGKTLILHRKKNRTCRVESANSLRKSDNLNKCLYLTTRNQKMRGLVMVPF